MTRAGGPTAPPAPMRRGRPAAGVRVRGAHALAVRKAPRRIPAPRGQIAVIRTLRNAIDPFPVSVDGDTLTLRSKAKAAAKRAAAARKEQGTSGGPPAVFASPGCVPRRQLCVLCAPAPTGAPDPKNAGFWCGHTAGILAAPTRFHGPLRSPEESTSGAHNGALKPKNMRLEGKRMASGHTGNVVPGNRLWVRIPCPPLW